MSARQPPFESDLRAYVDASSLLLLVPARGPHVAALLRLGGALLWLSVCTLWSATTLRATGRWSSLALSLPFWAFGLVAVGGAVGAMLNRYRLELGKDGAVLVCLPWRTRRRMGVGALRVNFDMVMRGEADGRGGVETPVLSLRDHGKTVRLLEGFSESEQRWAKGEIDRWLAGLRRDLSPPSSQPT